MNGMIGIIGGTGLEDPTLLTHAKEITVSTPYGDPASPITVGEIRGKKVAVLARHGRRHQFSPTHVNYRANIWALKQLGCHRVLASTACGSLREEMRPGELVIADNFIDWTRHRTSTFFEKDRVAHIPMA
ncbi:MAG: MTAP family purine nucleoside phosphorylase, partial [Candidatus Diapherotrites archaeon]|nr:MTAP family purine nucleoside phosphorylase [Candidatus Diapherotrites archaeon]